MLPIEFRLAYDDVKFFFKSEVKVAGGFIQYFDVVWIKYNVLDVLVSVSGLRNLFKGLDVL
jgi:hypothetical protein